MEHFRRVQLREVKLFSLAIVRELAPDLARCGRILWARGSDAAAKILTLELLGERLCWQKKKAQFH
jgi:hypothetical protein